MNNDGLISRSALLKHVRICKEAVSACANHDYMVGYASALSGMEGQICAAPAVDAVEVVRCRDCAHRGNDAERPMCTMESTWDEDDGCDYYRIDRTVDDGFCNCGAKMDA